MEENWKTFQRALNASRIRRRRHRRLTVAALTVLLLGGYSVARVAFRFEGPPPRLEARDIPLPPSDDCRDVLCRVVAPSPTVGPTGRYEERVEGRRVVYTFDPELQELARGVLRRYRVPYGAFVAVDPSTGRVLAMAEHSQEDPALRDFCRRATYPAASLVKLITASAALETGRIAPGTSVRYEGSPYVVFPRKIFPANPRYENNVATFAEALGQSNNVVFAKVGSGLVGAENLERKLAQFGFNREIPFDFRLQVSQAVVPREPYPMARTAAGFGDVYVSPVHAALLAAAVGNGGVMMKPYAVETVEDASGKIAYRAEPVSLGRCVSQETAKDLAEMMRMTVTRGTSTKVFTRYARRLWQDVKIAGKTGSLTGDNPPGMYEWFIGFAPADNPKIAVASLVVNHDLWHIKGTYVAQAVMREFFGM